MHKQLKKGIFACLCLYFFCLQLCDKIIADDTKTANLGEANLAGLGIAANSDKISLQSSEDSWDVNFQSEVSSNS